MSKEKLYRLSNAFILIEAVLWIIIQTPLSSRYIEYFAVALAAFFFLFCMEKSTAFVFTQLAFFCTLGADYHLILADEQNQLFGMLFFCGTQIFIFLRILLDEKDYIIIKTHLIVRAVASILILVATCYVLREKTDLLALVSMFYYVNLALNIIFAIVSTKKSAYLIIGLICFILCDTFVGLAAMGPYISVAEGSLVYTLTHTNINLIWLFYVPSQTFIALSLLPED